ncbi:MULTISPECIES: TIGR01777 family oxidoreductase [Halomonas]|uniref:Epimerase n=1 Tax=Halomonas halophila TaxID=29573 RepID=A0ABQ0U7F7_9GAMM|nr:MULTISPECIES: TIGR01777 family oxidoreductase [Halomonas]MDR5890456.1 TIGR01777 family oxidoreductase [Halomonas salina]WJY07019.1 TIGR01777 family oxidoreductase [Halomonas halophila]GEK74438.1 epimerase [Halomonas halophila]
MRILITGGSGFVGQALCRRLITDGHRVQVVSRDPGQARLKLPEGVDVRRSALDFVDTPPEAVVNLAGEPIAGKRWSEAQKERLLDSRLGATRELVQLCEQLKASHGRAPSVMVSASAMGYYGDQGDTVVTEETPPHDEFAHRLCQRWEAAAEGVTAFGTRLAILRLGLVLDSGGGMLQRLLPPFKLGLGGRLGDGTQFMPWVHRQDLVSAILLLLERDDLQGAFNGSAPHPVTNAVFTRLLARHLHRPALLPVPAKVLEIGLGEMSRLLLTGADMRPARLEEAGFAFRFPTLEEALTDILG